MIFNIQWGLGQTLGQPSLSFRHPHFSQPFSYWLPHEKRRFELQVSVAM